MTIETNKQNKRIQLNKKRSHGTGDEGITKKTAGFRTAENWKEKATIRRWMTLTKKWCETWRKPLFAGYTAGELLSLCFVGSYCEIRQRSTCVLTWSPNLKTKPPAQQNITWLVSVVQFVRLMVMDWKLKTPTVYAIYMQGWGPRQERVVDIASSVIPQNVCPFQRIINRNQLQKQENN